MPTQGEFLRLLERFQSFFGYSYKDDHSAEIFRIVKNWDDRRFIKCLEEMESTFTPKPNYSLPKPFEFKRWGISESVKDYQEPEGMGEPNPFQDRYVALVNRAVRQLDSKTYIRIFGDSKENKRLEIEDYGKFGNAWVKMCDDGKNEFSELLDNLEKFLNKEAA